MNTKAQRRHLDPFMHAMSTLRYSRTEQDVAYLLNTGLKSLGMPSWFLLLGTKGSEEPLSSTDLLGMSSDKSNWLERYVRNSWMLVDPFLLHTQHSNTPLICPYEVEGESSGQKDFLRELHANLFSYGVVAPVHLAQDRLALLYAGSQNATTHEELYGYAPLVTVLGQEVAIWLEDQRVAMARDQLSPLSDQDLDLLSLARKGFSTNEIAAMVGLNPGLVNNAFRRINLKLGTNSRQRAATLAENLGYYRLAMLSRRTAPYNESDTRG